MPIAPGTRLGPYEVLAPIGAGGMGEVYRARDTRLDRTVAIKILPQQLAATPEVRQRFEREARAISSLNHPHICALYDVGHQDGTDYLVMEYIEGETLAARLSRGPLPTGDLLRCAIEMADALDKVHRHGVVHRDLKPGNIMQTKSGAKLLDFGLAKAAGLAAGAGDLSVSPTVSKPLTVQGTIVGTFQYMSPEQLEGKETDARSDIFAFGAVLYEMATGKKAFEGSSQASLIAAILDKDPPPISSVQPMAPPALDRVVRTCLAKDPDERFQSAHDLKLQLEWIRDAGSQAGAPGVATISPTRRRKRELAAWVLAGVAVAVALLAVLWKPAAAPQQAIHVLLTRADRPLAENVTTSPLLNSPVLSPDGTKLVLESAGKLWLRPINDLSSHPIAGTEGGQYPFWSPDSRQIGFSTNDGKLKTVDTSGGPPVVVCAARDARGGTWNREGMIVFAPDIRSGLFQVPAAGGTPAPVTTVDNSKHSTHRWPHFLPDGKHILYLASNHQDPKGEHSGVYVASLDGKTSQLVLRGYSDAIYASGYLLFLRDASLLAQPFDPKTLGVSGTPVRIADNVQYNEGTWRAMISATETGLLAYLAAGSTPGAQLAWFDRAGKPLSLLGDRQLQFFPRLSPDRQRIALQLGDPSSDIWIVDAARGTRTRVTFGGAKRGGAAWSPDGRRIASSAPDKDGRNQIFVKSSDGTGKEVFLHPEPTHQFINDWSPDGRYILYERGEPGASDLYLMPADGKGEPVPLVATPAWEKQGAFSPDGRWVAYVSRETGVDEVYVLSYPGGGGKWQVSTQSGWFPRWGRGGKELFYLTVTDNTLTSVEVSVQGANFSTGRVQSLFRPLLSITPGISAAEFDVGLDGQRILVNSLGEAKPEPIVLVVNWTAELKKK